MAVFNSHKGCSCASSAAIKSFLMQRGQGSIGVAMVRMPGDLIMASDGNRLVVGEIGREAKVYAERCVRRVWGKCAVRVALASVKIVLLIIAVMVPAIAGGGPHNVLLVINQDSIDSREIGQYYQKKRGIPIQNVVNIRCSKSERVSSTEFEQQVRGPIAAALNKPELQNHIDYIVMTKGTPLRVDYGHYSGDFSASSVLTCVAHPEILTEVINPYGPLAEMSWGGVAPVESWRHDIVPGYRFYLVTRLDAYTISQGKQLVDGGLTASQQGVFFLDKRASASGGYATANERLGIQMGSAYKVLMANGKAAICDSTDELISNMADLLGHFSWSYHDPGYSLEKYTSNSFLPGSIADSYYSYSCASFTDPRNPKRNTPLMADLIPNGLSGGAGYVSEPYISTATYPDVLFARYSAGYNLAESFYAASPMLYWKTVVFGDPLMAPYATPPLVEILDQDKQLTKLDVIRADATDEAGIARVDFYFNGKLIGSKATPPYELQIDTTQYLVGWHEVEVVAYENSPVRTQGSATAAMEIVNEVSNLAKLGEALPYIDGQKVKITSKIVVAGTDQIGGSFYLEELDRSAGLRVVTSALVREGNKVSLLGPVGTLYGEKAVLNPVEVTIEDVGCPTAKPLCMLARDIGAGEPMYSLPCGWRPSGLRNIGILAKVTGQVTAIGSDVFYLDDGSGAYDGIGPGGIRVKAKGALPSVGNFVSVVGISGCDQVGATIVPTLRMRKPADLQIID